MRFAPPTVPGSLSFIATGTMADGGEPSSATPLTFQNFLEKMRHPSASELVKSVKSFISSFGSEGVADADAASVRIQQFLTNTESAFRGHPAWRGASDDELDASGEGLEKYLMTKLHPNLFAATVDDKRCDQHLFRRIKALRTFIKPEHLDIPPHFRIDVNWRVAEEELKKVNHFKAPRDKLVCVLNTCRIVNNLLNTVNKEKPSGADDFLPVLIYVVLRANPTQLQSNLRFIQRFRRESRLVSEAAYFFTNLQSAALFLASCGHTGFTNLDQDVFEAHMLAEGVDPGETPETMEFDEGEGDITSSAGDEQNNQSTSQKNTETDDLKLKVDKLRKKLDDKTNELKDYKEHVNQWQTRWCTVDDVEVEGAASLAAEDQKGTLRLPYKFAYARSDDLQVGDVPDLLQGYKQLALQYEALVRGTGAMINDAGSAGSMATTSSRSDGNTRDDSEKGLSKNGSRSKEPPLADVDGLGTLVENVSLSEKNEPDNDPFAGLVIGGSSDATSTRDSTFAGL